MIKVCLISCWYQNVSLANYSYDLKKALDKIDDFNVNVVGTFNLLRNAVSSPSVEAFIFASSNAAVGEQAPPITEEAIPTPLSPYGASKLACEAYCSAFAESYGLNTVSLRFANAYGPYSTHKTSVIAKFIRNHTRVNPIMFILVPGAENYLMKLVYLMND